MKASELIINPDGSVYHLGVRPYEVAPLIITVGDPERVPMVSKYFDTVRHRSSKREMVIHTGTLGNKDITVLSTGMGTDNIDIVMNELDALFNIDFESRSVKKEITSLNIIRVGTSGCIREEIPVDSLIVSEWAIGYDGLSGFYEHKPNEMQQVELPEMGGIKGSFHPASVTLLEKLATGFQRGVTYTAAGFYAPQGRQLRAKVSETNLLEKLQNIQLPDQKNVTNIEMETAGLYGLGEILGHEVISFSALLANRITGTFSSFPEKAVDGLIRTVLERCSIADL